LLLQQFEQIQESETGVHWTSYTSVHVLSTEESLNLTCVKMKHR
jgi:hypothetical protein